MDAGFSPVVPGTAVETVVALVADEVVAPSLPKSSSGHRQLAAGVVAVAADGAVDRAIDLIVADATSR